MTALVWDALSGAAVAAVGLLAVLAVAGPFVLSALGVESLTVGMPDTVTFLYTSDEISFSVGPAVLAVGAALGLVTRPPGAIDRGDAVRMKLPI